MTSTALRSNAEMREAVLFDGPSAAAKRSRFWLLLCLAAVIAAAGIVTESEATVIGAMIVAPLRTPILGVMLAVVLGDHNNLIRSVGLVVAGAVATIAIGYVMGLVVIVDVTSRTNTEVAGYSSAGIIDLIAALAVGVVGSLALARRDIGDTVPGVAIAISLVPPLTVVGLALESGAGRDAAGALLMFLANVAAILAVGMIAMSVYHVRSQRRIGPAASTVNRREAYWVVATLLVVIALLLARASWTSTRDTVTEADVGSIVATWADTVGWEVVDVESREADVIVSLEGPPPTPDLADLAVSLEESGHDPTHVQLDLSPRERIRVSDESPT